MKVPTPKTSRSTSGGGKKVYLVADAALPPTLLMPKLQRCFDAGLDLLQLYNTEKCGVGKLNALAELANSYRSKVLIYNDLKSVSATKIKALHSDEVLDLAMVEKKTGKLTYKGVTVGNDLDKIKQAALQGYDYISFCALFPTSSAQVCEFVNFDIIKKARKIFGGALFLAGGITTATVKKLAELDYDGIVAISAIFDAKKPEETIKIFKNQ